MADTTHDLTRIIRQYRPRRIAFYDRYSGELALPVVRTLQASSHATIGRLLAWAATTDASTRPRVIYITGGATAGDVPGHDSQDEKAVESYWTQPLLDGWSITSWHRDSKRWRVNYKRDGVAVDVAMGSAWFGEEHSARQCAGAWTLLGAMLRNTFDPHAVLMGTPGRTGADLLQRSLPPGVHYPRLPDDIRHILEHNFGQGRMEYPGFYPNAMVDGLHVLDARWMYAGSLRHLPIGPAEWNKRNPEYKGYRKAVYLIDTRVPDGWEHIGLAPYYSKVDDRTIWPRSPGRFLEGCWLTGAELALLYESGWPVNIKQSIVYAPEDAPGHDPARVWIEKMRELREWALLNQNELCLAAIRHLIIDTVGYVHRSAKAEIRWLPYAEKDKLPKDALLVLALRQGLRYSVKSQLDPEVDVLYRPEWAVQCWGSSRAKLNKMALTFDPRHILWLRNDALVLDFDPKLPDTGKIGAWRIKKSLLGPVQAPRTEAEYRELMKEAD